VLAALVSRAAQLLHARGEHVALALELAEVRHARRAARARRAPCAAGRGAGRGDEREALGDDRGELALHARDLHLQRAARRALVRAAPR